MDGEDYRTGSADSENSSDNSYVQVSSEDVPPIDSQQPLNVEDVPVSVDSSSDVPQPPIDDDQEEDMYEYEHEDTLEKREESPPVTDTSPPEAFDGSEFIESKEEPSSFESKPPEVPSRVEDVKPTAFIKSESTADVSLPEAKGYLSFLNALHPLILYMIYWRDLKLSAVVLGVCLVVLLTLTLNTLLHTIVLFLLSFLVVSLTYIVSKIVIDSFYNREVKNPFSDYLNRKIALPEEKIVEWTHFAIEKADRYFNRLVRLLLFDNIKQSLKFGLVLWILSFCTNCCTVLSTLFTVIVLAFSVPPLYERYQTAVDSNVGKVLKIVKETYCKVKSRIPYIGKAKAD